MDGKFYTNLCRFWICAGGIHLQIEAQLVKVANLLNFRRSFRLIFISWIIEKCPTDRLVYA